MCRYTPKHRHAHTSITYYIIITIIIIIIMFVMYYDSNYQ